MLRDAGRNCEYVGVKNNVLGRKSAVYKQLVCAAGHLYLALRARGLAFFVKEHHHCRRPVGVYQPRPAQELPGSFLERDGIHYGLALAAFQPCHDGLRRRRIYHQRDPGDIDFAGYHIDKAAHGSRAVYQAVVHTYIYHLRSCGHLCACNRQRLLIVAFAYQTGELGAAGHVAALTYIYKVGFGHYAQDLQAAENGRGGGLWQFSPVESKSLSPGPEHLGQSLDEFRRGAAAAAHNIDKAALGIGFHRLCKALGCLVVSP